MTVLAAEARARSELGGGSDATKFAISPITGELIPVDQMAEHMRISLIDPKWKLQKEAMLVGPSRCTLHCVPLTRFSPVSFPHISSPMSSPLIPLLFGLPPPPPRSPPPPPPISSPPSSLASVLRILRTLPALPLLPLLPILYTNQLTATMAT